MYILKNALTSIKRSKGRNILIGIIIIVIAISTTVTLAIRSSADNIIKAYEEKNNIEATITMNRRALMQNLRDGNKSQEEMINAFNNIKNLTEDEINNYGNSEYVKEYYYSFELNVKAKNLTEATDSLVKETTTTKTETSTSTKTKNLVEVVLIDQECHQVDLVDLVLQLQQEEKQLQQRQKKYLMKNQEMDHLH